MVSLSPHDVNRDSEKSSHLGEVFVFADLRELDWECYQKHPNFLSWQEELLFSVPHQSIKPNTERNA